MAYTDPTFGIEIECYLPEGGSRQELAAAISARLGRPNACQAEDYNHTTRPTWKIVTDGSLEDYIRGAEVVSPKLRGEAGFAAVRKVMDAITDYGCTVNKKCGLHVHVDANNLPTAFFRNLTKLYAHFEPVIDAMMPPSRRANAGNYCRSMTTATIRAIESAATLDALMNLYGHGDERRFRKLNLLASRRHGTVEFRQHSGTVDATKAINWVKLCLRMVEAATGTVEIGSRSAAAANNARPGTKAHLIGQMMLRPQGVTGREVQDATGWPSVSLPAQAALCGIAYITQRTGREVRYFAQAAAATSTTPATLPALLDTLGCAADERDYFTTRTANLTGPVTWAA